MYRVSLSADDDFEGWRDAARALAVSQIPASDIVWSVGSGGSDLFGDQPVPAANPLAGFGVPKPFIDLAQSAILHSDPERFSLLYAVLLRVRSQPSDMQDRADPLLRRVEMLAKAVRRDIHKMRAFVRFREVEDTGKTEKRYVAWFEPEHHIVRRNAGFFVRRFANMHWSILTPELSIHWDGERLQESPGAERGDAPSEDPVEDIWKGYYAAIFNPARLKVGAMLSEMPKKYWRNLPEASMIPNLIAGAQAREANMIAASPKPSAPPPTRAATPGDNAQGAWEALRADAMGCTRCHLHLLGTQTVFGEGPIGARLMIIGEQPGDQEDLAGRPFVGPAGKVFDAALEQAGIDRARVYLTNAVKHFKHELRGKRRIHQTPQTAEIQACRWWLQQETEIIRPRITLALGATAARAMIGKTVTIGKTRGAPIILENGGEGWVTVHPSYLLRIPDAAKAAEERERFVEDLRNVRERLEAA
ncbi:uracil-DNA glycosylase [Sphingobium sp. SCG-1]|uniref:UdgX family uracil-DNA binding protein n=1 Tax=Sphingobium sp. SCG-1 TaxID=2072936 RepID=UPI000CD6894F|nr:UdgX family uracil-DNA binding protein [Sphingobium sp. SCG-1]AUW59815.1 uracil-DNA glycosylase [Sphingobium sp. SCG-1]